MNKNKLAITTSYFNPHRSIYRYMAFCEFVGEIELNDIPLYTIEGYTDKPHLTDECKHIRYIKYRDRLFQKERLLNILIRQIPIDIEYVGFFDYDIIFENYDGLEDDIINAMKKHKVIQPFKDCKMLNEDGGVEYYKHSLCSGNNHPGFAWIIRREDLENMGGIYDMDITGEGDYIFGAAMIDKPYNIERFYTKRNIVGDTKEHGLKWFRLASSTIDGQFGYLDRTIYHLWHGKPKEYPYIKIKKILSEYEFSPYKHLVNDIDIPLEWTDKASIKIKDAVKQYLDGWDDGGKI